MSFFSKASPLVQKSTFFIIGAALFFSGYSFAVEQQKSDKEFSSASIVGIEDHSQNTVQTITNSSPQSQTPSLAPTDSPTPQPNEEQGSNTQDTPLVTNENKGEASLPSPRISGYISVTSSPVGAQILYSGDNGKTYKDSGKVSPNTLFNLAPSTSYKIKLSKDGYKESFTGSLTVVGGKTTAVNEALVSATENISSAPLTVSPIKDTGDISITSNPEDIKVLYSSDNGATFQEAKNIAHITSLKPGFYRIKLTKEGYEDWSQTKEVRAGDTTLFKATLVKK